MLRHALPKVDQEVLHFMEICSHNTVQDSLAVSTVHQQKGLHLKEGGRERERERESEREREREREI